MNPNRKQTMRTNYRNRNPGISGRDHFKLTALALGTLLIPALCSIRTLLLLIIVYAAAPVSAQNPHPIPANNAVNGPTPNPYLASSLYAIAHFDSSQSDSTPYGPPRGFFTVDLTTQPLAYGGPANLFTLASTKQNYMWHTGEDRVSYVYKNAGRWITLATYEALAHATQDSADPADYLPPIPDDNLRAFGESTAVGKTTAVMDNYMKSLFGDNYAQRFGNGIYSLVDKDNVLYANYGGSIYAFALNDPARPSDGITVLHKLEDVVKAIEGDTAPSGTKIKGLSLTYDGHLIITLSNGIAVVDRDLNAASIRFYRFSDAEYVSNSIAVDEKNGIYVASGWSGMVGTAPVSVMRKLVWTGISISDSESEGAWSSPYDNSGTALPPIIKLGNGTGSTPTLMGLGDDPDKLVVITDGAKQMKLVAFWRDQIPEGFTQRIAGQIQVTCGFAPPLPEWIQSEQSVVVHGYGAFVVNNLPQTFSPEIQSANNFVQVALMGPAYPTSLGAERFEWSPSTRTWSSVWARSDVSSTSMVPIHSQSGNMALINGYRLPNGWEVLGLDWNTGDIVHQTIFGNANFGNGAYALLQYLENQDLLFNSIVGAFRVHYGPGRKPSGGL